MRAIVYQRFGELPSLERMPDPNPPDDGVVVQVVRTGLCRSDWHAWQGHDDSVSLPHVGGHELSGVVVAVGSAVRRPLVGRRVTVPFVSGCGDCTPCREGEPQVCDRQYQPGFTGHGSFAELVALRHADDNLIELPPDLDFDVAAGLGCRFVTAYRAVVQLGKLREGEQLVVYGCGGVGLSALLIARALGARSIAVDVGAQALELARQLGADECVDGRAPGGPEAVVRELTRGGAHVSLDAVGHPSTLSASLASLRKRGRHVQVGLLLGSPDPSLPMNRIIAEELVVLGSHGIAACSYPEVFEFIRRNKLPLSSLIGRTLPLQQLPGALAALSKATPAGMTLIDPAA